MGCFVWIFNDGQPLIRFLSAKVAFSGCTGQEGTDGYRQADRRAGEFGYPFMRP